MFLRLISVIATAAILTAAPEIAFAQQGKQPQQKGKPHTKAVAHDLLPAQVVLDRAGFSPGDIDGRGGRNTQTAIAAFEKSTGTTIADALTASTDPATITYTISPEDAEVQTVPDILKDMNEKNNLKKHEY